MNNGALVRLVDVHKVTAPAKWKCRPCAAYRWRSNKANSSR